MTRKPLAPGDYISVKGWGRGIVLGIEGDNIYARTEGGEVLAHADEVKLSRNRKPLLRDALPYVMFVCADGREVLANRDYMPLWTRAGPGHIARRARPDEWINGIVREFWFWTEKPPHRSRKARAAAEAALFAFFAGTAVYPALVAYSEGGADVRG